MTKQEEIQITPNVPYQEYPAIYEETVVWLDYRNWNNARGNMDFYLYDLAKKQEARIHIDVPPNSYDHFFPAIYGDKIVWEDGSADDIYKYTDIYLYDLTKQETIRITQDRDAYDQFSPAIYGDFIVWEDYRNGSPDIYLYDLAKKTETRITNDDSSSFSSNINGNQDGIGLVVNGWPVGTHIPPRIIGGRVMVPIRAVSEMLGAYVRWDEKKNTIFMTTDENKEKPDPEIFDSSREIQLVMNGQPIKTDVPPKMLNGTTLVPIRTVAQALGAEVAWDPAHQRVTVVSLGILLKNTAYYIENALNWIDNYMIHTDKYGDGDFTSEKFGQVHYAQQMVERNYEAFKSVFGNKLKENQDLQMIDTRYQDAVKNMAYHYMTTVVVFEEPNAPEKLEKLAQFFSTYELD